MSTAQKVREAVDQECVQSENQTLSTKTWTKVFPNKLTTEQGSLMFVKRLMTVAISSITYIRGMFPEDAYANRSLDKLSLKILKEKTDHENAGTLAGWLLGAFEAIEKKYLKSLMLSVYVDPSCPNTVHEMYVFRFNYPGGVPTCEVQGTNKQSAKVAQDDIYRSTQNLLRTVLLITQGLGPLPTSAYLSIKLTYYDEVTPTDYEPTGYCATDIIDPIFPSGFQRYNSGKVSTAHHGVKLKVVALPRDIVGEVNTSAVITDDYLCSQSTVNPSSQSRDDSTLIENTSLVSQSHSQCVSKDMKIQSTSILSKDTEIQSASLLDQYLTVLCSCRNTHPDPLMLVCYFCSRFQHAACYRILEKAKVPATHCCVPCSQEDSNRVCTDLKLVKMSAKADVSGTCIFRRVLAILNVTSQVSHSLLSESLGIKEELSTNVLNKLEKEGVVVRCDGDQFQVDKLTLQRMILPKYLGIKTDVASIVKQTDEMTIDSNTKRVGDKRKKPSTVEEERKPKRMKRSAGTKDISVNNPRE